MEHQRIRQVKLYQLLLILFRTLFIVFLVLAFSRPAFRDTVLGFNSNASTTALFFIDDSYSMKAYAGANTRFEIAENTLRDVISLFSNDDRVFLQSPSKPEPFPVPMQGEPSKYLELYSPTSRSMDFFPAVRAAFRVFDRYPNVNREFYLVSDFQINQPAFPESLNTGVAKHGIRLFLIDPSESRPFHNISVDSVAIISQIFEINKPLLMDVHLRNHDPEEQKSVLLHLYKDGERVAMDQITLAAGAEQGVPMFYIPKTAGEQFLHIELEEDDLPTDNFFYFNITVPENIRVLIAGNRLHYGFNNAVDILHRNSVLDITYIGFDAWQGYNFEHFNTLVLENPPPFSSATTRRVEAFLETGKNIILIPGPGHDFSHYNALFRSYLKRDIYKAKKSSASAGDYFSFAPLDRHSPLFLALFSEGQYRFDSPKIYTYFELASTGETLLSLKNGDAYLSVFPADRGNIYVLHSGFDYTWSDISRKGFFVPFLYRLMYIAGQSAMESVRPLTVEENYSLRIPNRSISADFQLLTPSLTRIQMIPEQTPSGIQFELTGFNDPGHYKLYQDDLLLSAFSVNVSSGELRRPFIAKSDIDGISLAPGSGTAVAERITEARTGYELWPLLLGLALSMLLAEMIIIKRMEGAVRATSEPGLS